MSNQERLVRCGDCQHFRNGVAMMANGSTISTPTGIGQCVTEAPTRRYGVFMAAVDRWEQHGCRGPGPTPPRPLWPLVPRVCGMYEAKVKPDAPAGVG